MAGFHGLRFYSARRLRSMTLSSVRNARAHLEHPITQAVHYQLEGPRMARVERVATSGEIHVVTLIVRVEPIVAGVIVSANQASNSPVVRINSSGMMAIDNVV